MIREVSIEEPSAVGKVERSITVIFVEANEGRVERERAVERPNTPDPTMRIVLGGEKGAEDGRDILFSEGIAGFENWSSGMWM